MLASHAAGRRTACLLGVMALAAAVPAQAKRRAPWEAAPVVRDGVRYVVPHLGARHGKRQNGGYVQAWDIGSGKLLWDRQVYEVVVDPQLERDVQDVFIVRLTAEDGALIVENDLGEKFRMALASGGIEALVKKSPRTRAAPRPAAR